MILPVKCHLRFKTRKTHRRLRELDIYSLERSREIYMMIYACKKINWIKGNVLGQRTSQPVRNLVIKSTKIRKIIYNMYQRKVFECPAKEDDSIKCSAKWNKNPISSEYRNFQTVAKNDCRWVQNRQLCCAMRVSAENNNITSCQQAVYAMSATC